MTRDHLTLEECIILAKKVDIWNFTGSSDDATMIHGMFTGRLYQLNFALGRKPVQNRISPKYSLLVRYCPEIIKLRIEEHGDKFEIQKSIPFLNEGTELARFDNAHRLKGLYNDISRRLSLMDYGRPIVLVETNVTAESEGFRYADKFL